jgi:hypothetical protein
MQLLLPKTKKNFVIVNQCSHQNRIGRTLVVICSTSNNHICSYWNLVDIEFVHQQTSNRFFCELLHLHDITNTKLGPSDRLACKKFPHFLKNTPIMFLQTIRQPKGLATHFFPSPVHKPPNHKDRHKREPISYNRRFEGPVYLGDP